MYAQQHNLSEISIHLTYYHLDSQAEKTFVRHYPLAELEIFFRDLIIPYRDWFRKVYAWQARRDQSIQQLNFPYEGYRPGQRDMAVAVYKAIRANDRLYVQSPTGVGKTIAALFPAVKALGLGLVAKIFYLTAKTPGRLVAESALEDMRQANLNLRSVTLTAKEKICFCPPVNCDPEVCVFARDYFGKVKRALEEIDQHQAFTRPVIEADRPTSIRSALLSFRWTCLYGSIASSVITTMHSIRGFICTAFLISAQNRTSF
jgi:DNA excision repair protein ERCC-2